MEYIHLNFVHVQCNIRHIPLSRIIPCQELRFSHCWMMFHFELHNKISGDRYFDHVFGPRDLFASQSLCSAAIEAQAHSAHSLTPYSILLGMCIVQDEFLRALAIFHERGKSKQWNSLAPCDRQCALMLEANGHALPIANANAAKWSRGHLVARRSGQKIYSTKIIW